VDVIEQREALTDLDEDHEKRGSTTAENENDMHYRLSQDEMIDKYYELSC